MLTKEHAIARYDFQRQRILPDRLTSGEHAQYLQHAERMLDFAEKWGDEVRDGWTLEREAEVLLSGQKTFVPDFALRHNDGRTVLMEMRWVAGKAIPGSG